MKATKRTAPRWTPEQRAMWNRHRREEAKEKGEDDEDGEEDW